MGLFQLQSASGPWLVGEFLEKLAALTPRPEINLTLYHGARAPYARWRPEVVAYRRTERDRATDPAAVRAEPPALPYVTRQTVSWAPT